MKLISRLLVGCKMQFTIVLLMAVWQFFLFPDVSFGNSTKEQQAFTKSIIDYRAHLNPRFSKKERKCTKYIIVHTSECDLKTTLKLVSKGKQDNYKWISRGGHAHYVIAPDGTTYHILDEKYKANHAGISMWNGETSLNRFSIGIELVAYHNRNITTKQYRSVSMLIDILKKAYLLNDHAVLTHSQVAYAKPTQWYSKNHRGRKHCAQNFNRINAGLGPTWPYDPDVKAGRLQSDQELASIFYGNRLETGQNQIPYVINQNRTVWAIAGKRYNSPDTIYKFPDGLIISGNRIDSRIGWHRIPAGTKVFLY